VMDARLKKMRKQRDEYKKQRDELIGDMTEVKRKAKAFDEILKGLPNAMQDALKEDIYLDEAVGIMTGQVVYKYEEEQEND
ncbi:TPA: DUF1024 family protein, partial [Staphylococcus aureus]|nr:DUF1024 family protein [Staphylococcus aureus]HDC3754890.1 DUF1024 family protein [Staphylococcus aureus]HDC3771103.1 DUF1024 family protein [Staphylococcus aureus]